MEVKPAGPWARKGTAVFALGGKSSDHEVVAKRGGRKILLCPVLCTEFVDTKKPFGVQQGEIG